MKHLNSQPGVYCMNRGWRFQRNDATVFPASVSHDAVYGFSKGGGAKGPAAPDCDDSGWERVNLPHDWVTAFAPHPEGRPSQGYKDRGIAWYRRRFVLDTEDKNSQILLEFEGMSCDAAVYVNGTLLRHSFSGYNSFAVDITDMANFGAVPNVVAVRIDASGWEGWWYEGAGIYRNVWLVKKPAAHIARNGVYARPVKKADGRWSLEIQAETENSFETEQVFSLRAELFSPEGESLGTDGIRGTLGGYETAVNTFRIEAGSPRLWSPETPVLYRARVTLDGPCGTDYLEVPVGFRTIELDSETGFWLNGENRKLKGFCNHQDHAGVGAAVPYSVKEYRIRKLKDLGADAYRCAHNPDPEILDICDRLGMLVMEENRAFSSSEENLRDLEGIVKNARNHPSVILYSVFNEEPLQGTGKGRRMAGRMRDTIRRLDPNRPVMGAFNGGYMEEEGAATILDAVGINYNPARYDDFHRKYPKIPLMGSETSSAFMVRGEYRTDREAHLINSYDDECAPWGNTVRDAWRMIAERPFVAGTFVWTGFDYRGEPTPFVWPSVATFFGTYDSCGFDKDACWYYRAFWKKEKRVHLVSPWESGKEPGEPVRVQVISNCSRVEVFAGDTLQGSLDIDLYGQNELTVPYSGERLTAVGYADGKEAARDVQEPAGEPAALVLEASQPALSQGGYEAVCVNVSLVDEKGHVIPNRDMEVRFSVADGELLGVGNGDPNSHEDDRGPCRRLFHGRAQAIAAAGEELAFGKKRGAITVTAQAGALCASIEIPVAEAAYIPYLPAVEEQAVEGWGMYYRLLDEMPKVGETKEANDMNSFEPVEFMGNPQPQLSEQQDKFGWYRTRLRLGASDEERYLYFPAVLGRAWIFLDGRAAACKEAPGEAHMVVRLDGVPAGEHILEVVIQNVNREWLKAGILAPVALRTGKPGE